jgi:hypothetical protein
MVQSQIHLRRIPADPSQADNLGGIDASDQPLHAFAHLAQFGCHAVGKEEHAQLRVGGDEARPPSPAGTCSHIGENGVRLYQAAAELGVEGIVAKASRLALRSRSYVRMGEDQDADRHGG